MVEYFNPFRNVQIAENLDREELAKGVHTLGEVVGLGLRNLAHCPVELNLMPKSSLHRQELETKKPYFIASAACIVLAIFAAGWFYANVADQKREALEQIQSKMGPLQQLGNRLKSATNQLFATEIRADTYTGWILDRYYWPKFFSDVRTALRGVEKAKEAQLSGTKTGVWIERFQPVLPDGIIPGSVKVEAPAPGQPNAGRRGRNSFAPAPGRPGGRGPRPMPPRAQPGLNQPYGNPNNPGAGVELSHVKLVFQAMNLHNPAENTKMADMVAKALQRMTEWVDPKETTLESGTFNPDPNELTFDFEIMLKLKRPVQVN